MARSVAYLLAALVILVILSVLCIRHHVPLIEQDLTTRSRLALNDADLSNVTIKRIDGLNVVLGGVVESSSVRQKALNTVSGVYGVFDAKDEMSELSVAPVVLQAGQHRFSALADKVQVELTGMVRDAAMRASIVGAARRAFAQRRVIDQLEEVSSTPELWTPMLRDLLEQLAGFSSGKLDIRGTHLSLVGSVTSQGRKESAAEVLARVAGDAFTQRLDVAILTPANNVIDNCQASINTRLESSSIRFDTGSTSISVDSYPLLEELADIIASCEGMVVEIQGHTDSDGDEQGNLRLSERRARAVQDHLIDEGITVARLRARGYGELQPRADNATRDGRARNRRIEFVITGN